MPILEGMHAPGSERAHLLPPAGIRGSVDEVYRFHRVIPLYPPDPCIRPNEADLICTPEPEPKNYANMPAAGATPHQASDRFAFHKAREATSSKPPCSPDRRQITLSQRCPCSNSGNYRVRETSLAVSADCSHEPTRQQPIQWPPNTNMAARLPVTNGGNTYAQSQHCLPNFQNGNSFPPAHHQYQQQQPQQLSHQWLGHQDLINQIPDQYQVLGNISHGHDYITTSNAPRRAKIHPIGEEPDPACANPYIPAPYVCQPVYNRKYLDDCPEQDGPPADSYTFL